MKPKAPLKPLAPLAPLAPAQPMMPTQPLTPAGGSFGMPPVSTYNNVYNSYQKTKEETEKVVVQTNEPAVANDIFDPFFNEEVRSKYEDSIAPAIPAMAELVKRQFTSYSDEGVFGGLMTNLELIGESLDKVTGLPMRAVVNKFQTGESIGSTIKEGFTTNNGITGQDIRQQAGIDFGNDIGNWLGDMATEIVLDPTTWIGIGAATKLGKSNKVLQGINAALDAGQSVVGRGLSTMTPIGAIGLSVKGTDYLTNPIRLMTSNPATPITMADDLEKVKAKSRQTVTTNVSDEMPKEQLSTLTDKVMNIINKHPIKGEIIEMDDLAKQQSALDELFISATEKKVDNVFDDDTFKGYAQGDMTSPIKPTKVSMDAKEFYDYINTKLVNKDTSDLESLDKVIKNFEKYRSSERANELPLLQQYAERIQTQLEQSRQQLKDYDTLKRLVEEEGEYDLLYVVDYYIEMMKERGRGGRWDDLMINTWQRSVEPALKEMERNPHLLEQHPELKTIRDFLEWVEITPDKTVDPKELGEAIDRASTILERRELHPMSTEGFDFIFERAHSGTVPVTEAELIKAGLADIEHRGYELMAATSKADKEINAVLDELHNPFYQAEFKSVLENQLKQLEKADLTKLSQYSDDMALVDELKENIASLTEAISKHKSMKDIMAIYEDYQKNVEELMEYLTENTAKRTTDVVDGVNNAALLDGLNYLGRIEDLPESVLNRIGQDTSNFDTRESNLLQHKEFADNYEAEIVGNAIRVDEAWIRYRDKLIVKPLEEMRAKLQQFIDNPDLVEPDPYDKNVPRGRDYWEVRVKALEDLDKKYSEMYAKQQVAQRRVMMEAVDGVTIDTTTPSIEDIIKLPAELKSYLDEVNKVYESTISQYRDKYAHLQLNKQRTQAELIHNVRASEPLAKLFENYEDKENAIPWLLDTFAGVIPSVKSLKQSMDSIRAFEQFTKNFEEAMLQAGRDYDFDNRTLDALYGYLDKLKHNSTEIPKLEQRIFKQKEIIEAYTIRADRKGSTHLREVNIPQEQEILRRLEADLKRYKEPVDFPDILNGYKEVINDYVTLANERGYELAKVPDGPFSSQLKHVSDDLKNQFPLMEAMIEAREPNWSVEGLLRGDSTLDEKALETMFAAHELKNREDIAKLNAVRGEMTKLLEEAKGATREILKVYKDRNRELSNMFISNTDAWEFAKGFEMGHKNIAEYLQAENPRLMIKNGPALTREIRLKSWAKRILPDQPKRREDLVNRMLSHIQAVGADETHVIDIFLSQKQNHRLDVKFGESGKEIEKKLYETLFPDMKYEGDEYDLMMKNAIRRAEMILKPEAMVDLVSEKLVPKVMKENLTPDDFADNIREIYNTFRNREYVEALDYVITQTTKDVWDFLHNNSKFHAKQKTKQKVSEMYLNIDKMTPLSRDALLKGMIDNPMFQIAKHPKLNTWESASQIFKANPELRAVAVVESPKMPDGYTVKAFKLNNKFEYDQAIRLNAMVLDYESSEHLRSLFKNDPFRNKPLLRIWQKYFIQTFKVQALINVGFHVSNIFDLMLKNVSQGSIAQAPSNMFNILKGQLDYLNYTHRLKYKDISKMTEKELELYREIAAFRRTLASGGELTNEAIREGRSAVEKVRQWALYDNPISKGNQYIGNTLEEGGRLALFRQMKAQGKGTSRALQAILDTHFDYSNKSEAMQWAELIFPFTTFAVRNFLYWASKMGENPKLVEYIYEGLQYNYAEHGYDTDEGISNEYIKYSMGKGNLVMGDKIIKNGNSMLEAMNFVASPVESMSNRIHPIIKATVQKWAGEVADWDDLREEHPIIPEFLGQAADWSRLIPFSGQFKNLAKIEGIPNQVAKAMGVDVKPNELGLWNTIATPFYDPRLRNYDSYDYKGKYPDYPDYPKGQKYYPRYHKSRSYSTFRRTRSYNFYKSLYTSTGKSRLAMRLTPTTYRNLEGRIAADRFEMKY